MFSMGYIKLIFVFLITFLTLTAARRHGKKIQNDGSFESGESDIVQLQGNGQKIGRSHRGRGRYHKSHGVLRGNGGFNVGIQDGYPIRGPVQQPFIPTPSIDRSPAPHSFSEPYTNLQQIPANNFQYPTNDNQQSSIKFPQHPVAPTNSFQGVQDNIQEIARNYPQNNFQQQQANNFQFPANSIQQPSIRFPQHPGPPAQSFQEVQNNFQDTPNNYQKPPVPPNNFQQQSETNPSNNHQIQEPQPSVNPFLSQNGFNQQYQIQTPTQTQFSPVIPSTFVNKQNPHAFEPVTNELPTTVQPSDTTPSYVNPRRTDLLYGSNILEEDQRLNGKSTEIPQFSIDERSLFDTAPHCLEGYILVVNKCRLQV